jgi:RNA polymerase sigma factor (sigma-70 family)
MGEETSQSKRKRSTLTDEETQRRNQLFNELIKPKFRMIYKLTRQYTNDFADVKEFYYSVLTILYKGIETYDPTTDIRPWIHICTKRHVYKLNRERWKQEQRKDFDCNVSEQVAGSYELDDISANAMTIDNYRTMLSDDILIALDGLKPMYRDAFILQTTGYSLKEIAEIEYEKGNLSSPNIDTIKSRLFLARQQLRNSLHRNGTRKIAKKHS